MKTMATKIIRLLVMLIACTGISATAFSQNEYKCYIKNISQTNDRTLVFDVWIEWTGAGANKFQSFQAGIDFNYWVMANGGTITGAFVPGSADASLPAVQQVPNWTINSSSKQIRMLAAIATPSSTAVSIPAAPGIRLGSFKMTNTVAFLSNSTPDFTWQFETGSATTTKTAVTAYLNGASTAESVTTQTDPSSFTITASPQQHFVLSNPVCNPCSTAPSLSANVTNVSCNGSNDGAIQLTTTGGTGPFTYAWTKIGDALFSASTKNISNLSPGVYLVKVTASGGCGAGATYTVTQPAPLNPIVTTASACDSYTWNVNNVTYTSSGSYNATIGCQPYTLDLTITQSSTITTKANGCNSYTWAVNGQTYTSSGTYTSVSGCVTNVLNLTISTNIPAQPVEAAGNPKFNLCAGGNYTYTIKPVTGATGYTWTLPPTFTMVQNKGTSIVVNIPPGISTATISVTADNACGKSTPRNIVVNGKPSKAAISGPTCVVANQTGVQFSVTKPETGVIYKWKVPAGVKIKSGQQTSTITVDWGAASGTVTCTPSNSCGSGARGSLAVTVGCSAVAAAGETKDIFVYPNPTKGLTNILFAVSKETKYAIIITDINGKQLQKKEMTAIAGKNKVTINLSAYASGVYLVNVVSDESAETIKVIKSE